MRTLCIATAYVALTLGTVSCALDLFVIEAEAGEVCLTDTPIPFPGIPAIVGETTIETTTEREANLALPQGLSADVKLLGVGLNPLMDTHSLSFIKQLRLSLGSSNTDLPAVSLIDADLQATPDGPIFLESAAQANLVDYLASEHVTIDIAVTGQLPETSWTVGVDLCFAIAGELRQGFAL